MANKVKFNLKNVHVAPVTDSGYGTVIAIPGAVSLSLEAQGDTTKFYADGVVYYQTYANNGYEGSLEIALVPEAFRTDILGETLKGNMLVENVDATIKDFALGFQIDGDVKERLYWFYNCTASRPSVAGQTNEASKSPQTETLNVSCIGDADGNVKIVSGDSYTGTVSDWFSTVKEVPSGN